jgi:hypothetical protein
VLEKTNYRGEIHIHFSAQDKYDKTQADYLAHFDNVHLHAWNTYEHNIAGWLKTQNKLNTVLDEFLES